MKPEADAFELMEHRMVLDSSIAAANDALSLTDDQGKTYGTWSVSALTQKGVILDFSRPNKPTDNALIDSFNGKFRSECLNAHRFMSLYDARFEMEEWLKD